LLRLKGEGADFVFIQHLATGTLPVLLDAERLQLLDQIHFGGCSYALDKQVIGKAGAAAEGFTMTRTHPDFYATDLPVIKLMRDLQMKYHGRIVSEEQGYVGGGWVQGMIICEAVKRAVEKVGYENIDGVAVKEALDTLKDFDCDGLRTITYTPESHKGYDKAAIYEVRNGTLVRATDYTTAPTIVP
jgi:branched-chain amino acid transport system substrate-binding protein